LFVLVGTVGTRYKAIIALAIILQCGALAGGIGAGGCDERKNHGGNHGGEVRGKGVGHGDLTEVVRRGKGRGSRDEVVGALDVQLML